MDAPVTERRERALLAVRTIYAEPAALALPRGQQVVARWPGADVVEVPSAQRIPGLHDDAASVQRWVRTKTEVLAQGCARP